MSATELQILLTNDDSHRSALLEFIIAYLREIAELTIVLPKTQQSWKGKALTVFQPLHVNPITVFGEPAYEVNGTPADCVNLALHHLCPKPPQLVVSGINAGLNSGSCFLLSSGTVGACFEANICGVPALALSQYLDSMQMQHFKAHDTLPPTDLDRLRQQTSFALDRVVPPAIKSISDLPRPVTWNVNFPTEVTAETELRICPPGRSTYGDCFARTGENSFVHELDLSDLKRDLDPETDGSALLAGCITVSVLDLHALTSAHRELAEFAKAFNV